MREPNTRRTGQETERFQAFSNSGKVVYSGNDTFATISTDTHENRFKVANGKMNSGNPSMGFSGRVPTCAQNLRHVNQISVGYSTAIVVKYAT